jgi:hypothetical protein
VNILAVIHGRYGETTCTISASYYLNNLNRGDHNSFGEVIKKREI